MAKSLNRIQILGNLGRDPEAKQAQNGNTYCKFSVATTESIKKGENQWEDKTEWHNVSLFGHNANSALKWLKKGSKVYVEGKMTTIKFERDGVEQYYSSIAGDRYILCEKREESQMSQESQVAPPKLDADGLPSLDDIPF